MNKNMISRLKFEEMGEIWYQRTINLRLAWLDEKRPLENRAKALYLWAIMYARMNKLISIQTKIRLRSYSGYQPAGFCAEKYGKETVFKIDAAGYP